MTSLNDHWSGPNGCHPDCPACADERTPAQDRELLNEENLNRAAPELLALVRAYKKRFPKHALSQKATQVLQKLRPIATTHISLQPPQTKQPVPCPST